MKIQTNLQRTCLAWLLLVTAVLSVSAAPKGGPLQTGIAVFYSDRMNGKGVSLKGEKYDKTALMAATHRQYSLGSSLRVTNLLNNKSVTVKVNDRMNPKSKCIIDLSRKAAEELDMVHAGHAKVRIEPVS